MYVSEPHKELAVCNEKYVKDCTELVMSYRNIDVIGNFDAFVSLEVLWLNNNNIEILAGLDTCFRIKYLYVQNNHIASLQGSSLPHFSFLRELRLSNNNLQDLHATLRLLTKCVHLEDLDLFGNPLAEEDKYRLHVIAAIPSLHVFDRHVITDDERRDAKKLSLKRPTGAALHHQQHVTTTGPAQRYAPLSGTVKMLLKEVSQIERDRKRQEEMAREETFQLLSQSTAAVGSGSAHASNASLKTLATTCGMDEWVMCHLRKLFKSLDSHKLGGVLGTQLPVVVGEMMDQGQYLVWQGEPLHEEESDFADLLKLIAKTIGPDPHDDDEKPRQLVTWATFSAAFAQRHVGPDQTPLFWSPMPAAALSERADDYFDKARVLQKKLALLADPSEDLKHKIHTFSQRGYHLQTLRDVAMDSSCRAASLVATQNQPLPPVARDTVTLFAYKTKGKTQPQPALAQPQDDKNRLGAKYAVQSKDFQSFLATKDARKPVRITKQTFPL
ncbi:Aste57867_9980 [Aphanomyces stellatus]|uniref:Aste57867_9980 protein n=1 Tax=Aphanomyces stellatus TaxID=120398 RepID=A0A485KPP1_9STRA|nr:hypothetical protein As57867_009941 [Aphanomyces stellatus]VFT86858.1 Aste57867_9980 [Aphanomyces stellatus]